MKIAEIRNVIDRLNWARSYHTGGTRDENRRNRLDANLAPYIADVKALEIPPRFARDIERKENALQHAENVLARWENSQLQAKEN
jgi:hypothetical protein